MQLKTISEELENQKSQKWDIYSVPIDELKMGYYEGPTKISVLHPETHNVLSHPLTRPAHQQLAERLDIPWKYYERMLQESTTLLADNVNTWLAGNGKRKFFIRGMGNDIRAILSDRYRVIDHLDVLMCALNELQGKAEVENSHLSETNLFLKFKCSDLKAHIRGVDDEIIGGILLANSETGHGAVSAKPRIFRVLCLNGMVMESLATRQIHLGSGGASLDDDKVFLDIRASIRGIFEQFGTVVNQLKNTTDVMVKDPTLTINNVIREYGLSDKQKENILVSFGVEKDKTQYGIANAVTRAAQDEEKFENELELERLGGKLVEMKPEAFYALSQN